MIMSVLAASVSSCVKENNDEKGNSENMSKLSFSAGGHETKASYSTALSTMEPSIIPLELEGFEEPLIIESTVSELGSVIETKGTPAFTENLASLYPNISVRAIDYSDGADYLAEADFVYDSSGNTWDHTYSDKEKWPEGNGDLLFFLQAPSGEIPGMSNRTYEKATSGNAIIEYDYNCASHGESGTDAESQPDILFAARTINEGNCDSDGNRVLFYHSLAGVKFKCDPSSGIVVDAVSLNGIMSQGHCTIMPAYGPFGSNEASYPTSNSGGIDSSKSEDCADWTNVSTPVTYKQVFDNDDQSVDCPSEWPDAFKNANAHKANVNSSDFSKTFMVIPQSITAITVTLDFTCLSDGRHDSKTISIYSSNSTVSEWKAGNLYTYTIKGNFEQGIDIVVTDEMDDEGLVKTNPLVTNYGPSNAYVRAAIVGYWVDDDSGNVVCQWTENSTAGYFENLPLSNWFKGPDGYYYYTQPVPKNESVKLFDSYTLVTPPASASNATLQIVIVAQGVLYDSDKEYVTEAWGESIASRLN